MPFSWLPVLVCVYLQAKCAKREKEAAAAQEGVAKERSKLEALSEQLKARRTELTAQV